MPNWKKVIVSGSDATLNSLNVVSGSTISGSIRTTGSLTVIGSESITGSFAVSGAAGTTVFSANADTLVFSGSLYTSGSISATGSLSVNGGITGSLLGTASYAITASYAMNGGSGGGTGVIYVLDEGNYLNSASYFDFVGAGVTATVTNGTASINVAGGGGGGQSGGNAILNQTVAATTWSFTHNLSTLYPVFQVFDSNSDVIIPQAISAETTSSALIYFSTPRTGTAVATIGGDIVSASYSLVALSASYANNATSASYSLNATSASYANSSSFSVYAQTASYAENIQISGSITNVESIIFNKTAGISVVEGEMAWNNSDGTLDIGLNFGDVVLQVGQEQHFVVRNATGTTISNGTSVYASGLSAGSKRIEASPFTADGTTDEVRFLGLATHNISDGVNGVVTNFGYVRGLDTRGTSVTAISVGDETWAEGDILYAHPTAAGKLTKYAPKDKITVAMVTTRHQTTGVLFVRPSSFGHLNDIHDVNISTGSLSTGDLLIYDSGSDYWINSKQLSGSYGLTGSLSATSFTGSLFGTASYATNALTASYALVAASGGFPYTGSALITGSLVVTGAVNSTLGFTGSLQGTASYASNALTASYALVAAAGGFPYTGSALITGSLGVTGSVNSTLGFTGSLLGTSSYATSASYATFATTASSAPGYTVSFTQSVAAATWSFVHNMNTRYPIVQVYGSDYKQVIPNDIVGVDVNTVEVRFDYAATGYVIMSNGGGLYVTGSTSLLNQTSAATTWSFTHNLNSKYVNFEVYDSNDYVLIPSAIRAIDVNSAELHFAGATAGKAVANFSGINGAPNATTASYALTATSASYAVNATTASYALTSEWTGLNGNPISASLGTAAVSSTSVVASTATGSYYAAFFDYAATSGSNSRAGTVMSVWNAGSISYNEVTTNDIGNTSQVTMSVDLSGANVRLKATTTTQWTIRSLVRLV